MGSFTFDNGKMIEIIEGDPSATHEGVPYVTLTHAGVKKESERFAFICTTEAEAWNKFSAVFQAYTKDATKIVWRLRPQAEYLDQESCWDAFNGGWIVRCRLIVERDEVKAIDDNVVPFTRTGWLGDGIALNPDMILDKARGDFKQVVVAGFNQDGQIDLRSSHGSRETLWILQRAILHLMLETE